MPMIPVDLESGVFQLEYEPFWLEFETSASR